MAVLNNTGIRAGASAAGGDTLKEIPNSLIFDKEPDRSYMSRTPSSSGNAEKWTFSIWYKPCDVWHSATLFSAGTSSSTRSEIKVEGTGQSGQVMVVTNNAVIRRTNRALGDNGNWYHLVVTCDTGEGAADDRMKMWINGSQITEWHTKATISSGAGNFLFNTNVLHAIGADTSDFSDWTDWLDAKVAEVYILDGVAKEASDFGFEDEDTGMWQPKDYSGSVGTQGAKLDFTNTSNTAALGTDAAGSNNWTMNGSFITSNEIGTKTTPTGWRKGENADDAWNDSSSTQNSVSSCGSFSPDQMIWMDLGSAQWVGEVTYKATVSGSWANDSRAWWMYKTDDPANRGNSYWSQSVVVGAYNNSGTTTFRMFNRDGDKKRYWGITQGHGASGSNYTFNDFYADEWRNYKHLDISSDTPSSYLPAGGNDALGGVTRGNYAIIAPFDCGRIEPKWYLREGLSFWDADDHSLTAYGNVPMTSGKWYWELTLDTGKQILNHSGSSNSGGFSACMGIASQFKRPDAEQAIHTGTRNNYYIETNHGSDGTTNLPAYLYHNNTALITNWPNNQLVDDTIGIAFDADSGKLWFSINGTWLNDGSGNTGNPATGAYPAVTVNDDYAPYVATIGCRDDSHHDRFQGYVNFGDQAFRTAAPSGFKTLCDTNLPAPGIGTKGSKYFDVVRYSGDDGAAKSISLNNAENTPAIVLIKHESGAGSDWVIQDAVRGWNSGNKLSTSTDKRESIVDNGSTDPKWGYVDAVAAGSFTVNASTDGNQVNKSGSDYIAYVWGGGALNGSTNTAGSINISAGNQWVNSTAGFSVTKFAGSSGSQTIGHGLSATPAMVWVKCLDVDDQAWTVYHRSLDTGDYMKLNTNDQKIDYPMFNDQHPSSTVIPLGNDDQTSGNGRNYICYAWAPVPGFSAFGEYQGSGHAYHSAFSNCGFTPKMIIVKAVDSATQEWIINTSALDNSGESGNQVDRFLCLHNNAAAASGRGMSYYSSGVHQRNSSSGATNNDGTKYIWAAWADIPFKYSRGF